MKHFLFTLFIGIFCCTYIIPVGFSQNRGQNITMETVFNKTVIIKSNLELSKMQASVIRVPADYSTIREGISAANSGDTVRVAAGTFHENDIDMKKGVVIQGAGMDLTTVDGDGKTIFNGADSAVIEGFTITNASGTIEKGILGSSSSLIIRNNRITNCYHGVYVNTNAIIQNNVFSGNTSAAIFCGTSDPGENPQINGNLIVNNDDGIVGVSSDIIAYNNTLDLNYTGFWIQKGSNDTTEMEVNLYNNIISNSEWYGIFLSLSGEYAVNPDNMTIVYNDIWGNSSDYNGGWEPADNNISANPLYIGNEIIGKVLYKSGSSGIDIDKKILLYKTINEYYNSNNEADREDLLRILSAQSIHIKQLKSVSTVDSADYQLRVNSPCIDTGDPSSSFDPDGTRADMGAFFYDQSVTGIVNFENSAHFELSQNYPNPFSSKTVIPFKVFEVCDVDIRIYNLAGREVNILTHNKYVAGSYQVIWEGDDNKGRKMLNGLYLVKMRVGKKVMTRKLVFQKE